MSTDTRLTLDGIKVAATDYAKLDRIASMLMGELPDLPPSVERNARRAAVRQAIELLATWRRLAVPAFTEASQAGR